MAPVHSQVKIYKVQYDMAQQFLPRLARSNSRLLEKLSRQLQKPSRQSFKKIDAKEWFQPDTEFVPVRTLIPSASCYEKPQKEHFEINNQLESFPKHINVTLGESHPSESALSSNTRRVLLRVNKVAINPKLQTQSND
jgi:hypothetical protein